MKKMYLLFSHTLTEAQKADAGETLGIRTFVPLPENLQQLWSDIPPDAENLREHLRPLLEYVRQHVTPDDVVLIQGDFGATCLMVQVVQYLGAKAVHATTRRNVIQEHDGDTVIKRSVFEHVRFRTYAPCSLQKGSA